RSELADGFGDEARRKRVEPVGYREESARVRTPPRVSANPVDERKRREMITHARGSARLASGRRRRPLPLRCDHQLAKRLGCEQARNLLDLHRRSEALDRDLREVRLELREADVGDEALLLEFRLGQRTSCVLDDLAARDLDLESPLQATHHAESVDRLRALVLAL